MLERLLQAWVRQQQPRNTRRAYSRYADQYVDFCRARGLHPARHTSLALFMLHGLRARKLSRSTILGFCSAVADLFRYEEASPTHHPLITEMRRCVRRLTRGSVPKRPITNVHLRAMVRHVKPSERSVRDMFMMILMFVAFLRECELSALKPDDVWVEEAVPGREVLYIFVAIAKNDQERRGHTVVVEAAPGCSLCPVAWFRRYTRLRRPQAVTFFHRPAASARPLGADYPNRVLKAQLTAIGVNPDPYGSHSLRRGGATAAAQAGIAVHVIARHGNWKSDAVFAYITDSLEQRLAVGRAIR